MSVIHEYEGEKGVCERCRGGFVPIRTHRYLDGELVEISKDDLKEAQKKQRNGFPIDACDSFSSKEARRR